MSNARGLKFVALISGGKDSLFSILHCTKNEHECLALANLYPPHVQLDANGNQIENDADTDSFMFQTVGHSVIPFYADALGLPLYRRRISGNAVDQTLAYSPTAGTDGNDEAEDMYLLLKDVITNHPEVQAVSTGAILSTYQRVRVESVVIRLGLIPLSYLWQYPYLPPHMPVDDTRLLEDMRAVKQVAQIIKVASGGLDESILGMDVASEQTIMRLKSKMSRFSPGVGAVLGEGGEFETLALEGPTPLWKKRITVKHTNVVTSGGGSYALHFTGLEAQQYAEGENQGTIDHLRIPSIFPLNNSPVFDAVHNFIFGSSKDHQIVGYRKSHPPLASVPFRLQDFGVDSQSGTKLSIVEHAHCVRFSNMIGTGKSAQNQMDSIVSAIRSKLRDSYGLDTCAILSTTILLRDMNDFVPINKAYSSLFTKALPPARVTVAVGDLLPSGKHVSLSLTADKRTRERRGLHVQSRSYWAPANIGPYSQAISEPIDLIYFENESQESGVTLVHIAGQIPLVPASMDVLSGTEVDQYRRYCKVTDVTTELAVNRAQIYLSLQNLLNVMQGMELEPKHLLAGVAFFRMFDPSFAKDATKMWEMMVSGNSPRGDGRTADAATPSRLSADSDRANEMSLQHEASQQLAPPCFVMFVSNLPRNALVEWWSMGLGVRELSLTCHQDANGIVYYNFSSNSADIEVTWICVKDIKSIRSIGGPSARFNCAHLNEGSSLLTLFSTTSIDSELLEKWRPTLIPCQSILHNDEKYDVLILAIRYLVGPVES
jgi:diphthine-ammonia ligase